jgi:hypothetical protein
MVGTSDPLGDVIADPQRVRDDGQGRVHRADRGHEAAVHDVQVGPLPTTRTS